MNISQHITSVRVATLALAAAVFLAACGGSSDSAPVVETPTATTGTVGLLFTDKPTDEFSAIKLNVVQAILLGGDDGQQVLFEGSEPIDLLDLTNFSKPIMFEEVGVGTYTKLRLVIDNLELVPHDGGPSIFPRLPANGKIDLLDQDGFAVLPGRTLIAEVDMDANKSIKVTGTGKSGKYQFRPVVKVTFSDRESDDGTSYKLVRLEGTVTENDAAGSFIVCDIDTPDNCVDVSTGDSTSFFGSDGSPTDFTGLGIASPVVVIGQYEMTPDIVLSALVVEIGGNTEQVKGEVVGNATNNPFLLLAEGGTNLNVEAQIGTRYFDKDGEVGADSVVIGAAVEIEGVKPAKADPADPDLIRAALVFIEAPDEEQISGTINSEIAGSTFDLLLADSSTSVSVTVADSTVILLVDEAASEIASGDITSLANGQSVEIFGASGGEGLFDASEIIVLVDSSGT